LNICKVETLRAEIDKLAQVMEQQLADEWQANGTDRQFHDALLLAHWEAQSYNGEQFVDLYDFCHCLELRVDDGAVAEQCRAVQEFLRNEFVLTSCYCGAAYQYSYGVSLYFPWSQVAPSYWNLDFCKDAKGSSWGSFLKTYTLLTRRLPRGINGDSNLGRALTSTIEDCLLSVRTSTEQLGGEGSDRMGSDRMGTDRMGTDRMGSDRMNSGLAKNYIHSMRNPPNVFFPDECLLKRRSTLLTEEILRLQ